MGTETDATKWQKLLVFPPEHHPAGCERLVELTRMLPRDPQSAAQIAMLKFWIGFARRHGRALVYLAHHHLAMYEGNACFNLTAELLRHVLADTEGDLYPATLTALGVIGGRAEPAHPLPADGGGGGRGAAGEHRCPGPDRASAGAGSWRAAGGICGWWMCRRGRWCGFPPDPFHWNGSFQQMLKGRESLKS